jgi:hypothetical protein
MSTTSVQSSFGYKPQYSQVSVDGLRQGGLRDPISNTVTTVTNAGSFTAAQALAGMIIHDGTSGNLTTPSAAAVMALMPGVAVGTAFDVHVRNNGSATSTLVAGSGVTLDGTADTADGSCKTWRFTVSNNALGSEAITCYSLGESVF